MVKVHIVAEPRSDYSFQDLDEGDNEAIMMSRDNQHPHKRNSPGCWQDLEEEEQHNFTTATYKMNKWTTIPMKNDSVPVERHGHTVVNYKDKLYLFGGTPDGSSGLSDLLVLDAVNNCWIRPTVHGVLPSGRYRHTATVIGSKMYLFTVIAAFVVSV